MMRLFLSVLLLCVSCAVSAAQIAPKLRAEVLVSSDVVTVGDLLIGAYRHAAMPVLRAPQLGQSGEVESGDIARVLYERGIRTVDLAGLEHVTIRRIDNLMRRQKISSLLTYEISKVTNAPLSAIELVEGDLPNSVRHDKGSGDKVHKAQIVDLEIDEKNDRITARLLTSVNDQLRETMLVARGSVLKQVIVVNDAMPTGSIIRRADISLKFVPKRLAKLGYDNPEMVLGRQLTRSVYHGDPLRKNDLRMPTLVTQNEDVLLKLNSSGMSITARGRAMQNGAFGDVIEVMNIRSKKLVFGTVQSDGTVLVGGNAPPMTASQARMSRQKKTVLYSGLKKSADQGA